MFHDIKSSTKQKQKNRKHTHTVSSYVSSLFIGIKFVSVVVVVFIFKTNSDLLKSMTFILGPPDL